jgi:hypothetical protein
VISISQAEERTLQPKRKRDRSVVQIFAAVWNCVHRGDAVRRRAMHLVLFLPDCMPTSTSLRSLRPMFQLKHLRSSFHLRVADESISPSCITDAGISSGDP